MTWMPNIPVALAAVDFEQKHADMLASARGVKAEGVQRDREEGKAMRAALAWLQEKPPSVSGLFSRAPRLRAASVCANVE